MRNLRTLPILLASLVVPSLAAAQSPRPYVTLFGGGAGFEPGFTIARGWTGSLGATAGVDVTRRFGVEIGVSRNTSDLSGIRSTEYYPWGRAGMTTQEVLASGAVSVEHREQRHVWREYSILGRIRLQPRGRIEPAVILGMTSQDVTSIHLDDAVVGPREQYSIVQRPWRSEHNQVFMVGGVEGAYRLTRRLSIVPAMRVEVGYYADADSDVMLKPTVGLRWTF